ncbi:MAG: hypothetical protein HWE30_00490 [Methylocystaceae bacterium]|nr:hypothetical protein [Methylocystaceae bacterium]
MELLLILLISICFVVLLYGPWRSLWLSWGRQRLFEIRDKLFLKAANGEISFEDSVYKEFRESINNNIRFLHHATIPRIVASTFISRKMDVKDELANAVTAVENQDLKEELTRFRAKILVTVAFCVVLRSPLSAVFFIVAALFAIAFHRFSCAQQYMYSAIQKIVSVSSHNPASHRNYRNA